MKSKVICACKMGDISSILHFCFSEPNHTITPTVHSFMTEGGEEEVSRNTECLAVACCAVLSEVQLCVHDETANGDSVLRILRVFYLNFAVD